MRCAPLAIYVLFAIVYSIFLISDLNDGERHLKKKRSEVAWAIAWLVLWGFILGWFCYNSDETAAWWLLVLPWILGITLILFSVSMLFFIIAGGGGYHNHTPATEAQYKYSLAELQKHITAL